MEIKQNVVADEFLSHSIIGIIFFVSLIRTNSWSTKFSIFFLRFVFGKCFVSFWNFDYQRFESITVRANRRATCLLYTTHTGFFFIQEWESCHNLMNIFESCEQKNSQIFFGIATDISSNYLLYTVHLIITGKL